MRYVQRGAKSVQLPDALPCHIWDNRELMAVPPDPADGMVVRLAQLVQGAFSRFVVKSALAAELKLCSLTPISWAFAFYMLRLDKPVAQGVGVFVFVAGLVPLIAFVVDHRYLVRHKPELLRSEQHEYRMAKLFAERQGQARRVLDASELRAIPNPEVRQIAATEEGK